MEFPTDKTPFNWICVDTEENSILAARLFHTACAYQKLNADREALVLFEGRDSKIYLLKIYVY